MEQEEERRLSDTTMPRILRYSCVVATMAAVESGLASICREVQRRRHLTLSVEELAGRGIFRARNYLLKVAGIDLADLDKDWTALTHWQRVRNVVAHTNGNIRNASQARKLRQVIKQIAGVTVIDDFASLGDVWIEAGACERLIMVGQSFVAAVAERALVRSPKS